MAFHYQIEVLEPLDADLSRYQLEAGRYVLGRSSDCDLVLDVTGLSRRHLCLEVLADGGALVTDQGSTNGTHLDGRPIERAAVNGDFVLDLGAAVLRFRALDPALADLAYRTDHAPQTVPETRSSPDPATAVLGLAQSLRDAYRSAGPALPDPAGLIQPALAAWCDALQSSAIALKTRDGRTLAQHGAASEACKAVWSNEAYTLDLDPDCPNLTLAGDVLGSFLEWLPRPLPGVVKADTSSPGESFPGVWPSDKAFQRQMVALQRVARSKVSVLLLGETGTGKDLLARWIHARSPRADGPFVAINCAALPQDLLEAELFGIEAGAATGVTARPGVFERAHGGTLFLDELGDMPPETQVRLLRVLEDGSLYRIGASELRPVDIRLVSATNRDLEEAIEQRDFRLDLFHRLAAFEVRVPALRDRQGDIAALAIHFFNAALSASDQRSPGMTRQALLALEQWHWPGNVRELKQAIDSATALLHPGEALDQSHLPSRLARLMVEDREPDAPCHGSSTLADAVARAEHEAIAAAIRASNGVPEAAWTRLGIGKTTFYKKLKEYDLELSASDGLK
jgi:DNA-binding NtrC family response regulator